MKRADLDHLLRAAGDVTGHKEFVLVGSTAIFAWYENVPDQMAMSREADLFADGVSKEQAEDISDLLENIGQLSIFDDTHGYYVDGIGPETPVLPVDWRERSKAYQSPATNGVVAIVPHPDDIALSKLVRGVEKDLDWIAAAFRVGFVDLDEVERRIDFLPPITDEQRSRFLEILEIVRRRQA